MRTLCFFAGMLLSSFYCLGMPSIFLLVSLLFLSVFVLVKRYRASIFLAMFSIGVVWFLLARMFLVPQPLSLEELYRPVMITAKITGLVTREVDRQQFQVSVIKPFQANVRLSHWGSPRGFMPGQIWSFYVKLKPLRGLSNPGGFDLTRWAEMQGLSAEGYILDKKSMRIVSPASRFIPQDWRQRWLDRLYRLTDNDEAGHLIAGIVFGDKSRISFATQQAFQLTGTSHLLAISGLHVGFLATIIFFASRLIFRCIPRLLFVLALDQWAAIITLLFCFLYIALSGYSVSAVRAYIMLSVFMLGILLKRQAFSWEGLRLALCCVLIAMPMSIYSPGFYLSFCAVFIILMFNSGYLRRRKERFALARLQYVIVLAMLPLSVWYFDRFSVLSPPINFIVIPVFGFLIFPLSVLVVLCLNLPSILFHFFYTIDRFLIDYLLMALHFFSSLHFSIVRFSLKSPLDLSFALLIVLIFLLPTGFLSKRIAAFLLLPLIFSAKQLPKGELQVNLFDVGQGLAVLLTTAHHRLLFDTGPRYSATSNAGQRVILPYLAREEALGLNAIVLSHWDADHSGGLRSLLEVYPKTPVYAYHRRRGFKGHFVACRDQHWIWDGVEFQLLRPGGRWRESNNQACLLQVSTGGERFLLLGDIERPVEKQLNQQFGAKLRSDFMLVPHHGSQTSSSWSFIREVNPKVVLVSAGFANRFHFPKLQILHRYQSLGIETYNTADLGMVSFRLSSSGAHHWQFNRLES